MYQRTGLTPPPVGAVVNSTLALMSRVATGDYIALMPLQIARQALAMNDIDLVPIEEQGYPLEVGAILRGEAALLPVLRHFIAHLHRSAHHVTNLFRGEALHL
ncbi:LysR substrate-binding domain-containing protein [Comamonadaceae bacterium PP-2]